MRLLAWDFELGRWFQRPRYKMSNPDLGSSTIVGLLSIACVRPNLVFIAHRIQSTPDHSWYLSYLLFPYVITTTGAFLAVGILWIL
jgi:hypothetical protein